MQIPLYPAALFQSEADGEGINIVMYYKINESFTKELSSNFQEGIRVRYRTDCFHSVSPSKSLSSCKSFLVKVYAISVHHHLICCWKCLEIDVLPIF